MNAEISGFYLSFDSIHALSTVAEQLIPLNDSYLQLRSGAAPKWFRHFDRKSSCIRYYRPTPLSNNRSGRSASFGLEKQIYATVDSGPIASHVVNDGVAYTVQIVVDSLGRLEHILGAKLSYIITECDNLD